VNPPVGKHSASDCNPSPIECLATASRYCLRKPNGRLGSDYGFHLSLRPSVACRLDRIPLLH
ncbi:MAG: hypothetical protein ACKN9U_05335, partial [Pirellulaceae bacterium]